MGASADKDGFVGDKISPDLREMMGSDPNKVVKVILQSDDMNNSALLAVLDRNNVTIDSRLDSMNMLVVNMPVRVAEEIAAVQGARHLSLDQPVKLLGHIETTTGVYQVRNILNQSSTTLLGGVLGLLGGATATNQLDGTGVGIAIVDSGTFEKHNSYMDKNDMDRVVKSVDFTGEPGATNDPYGHGSHVAGLAAGSQGKGTELNNYTGIATNAKIINVRVLGRAGTG